MHTNCITFILLIAFGYLILNNWPDQFPSGKKKSLRWLLFHSLLDFVYPHSLPLAFSSHTQKGGKSQTKEWDYRLWLRFNSATGAVISNSDPPHIFAAVLQLTAAFVAIPKGGSSLALNEFFLLFFFECFFCRLFSPLLLFFFPRTRYLRPSEWKVERLNIGVYSESQSYATFTPLVGRLNLQVRRPNYLFIVVGVCSL